MPELAPSPLDTRRFGVEIARAEVTTQAEAEAVVEHARRSGVRMVIARAPTRALDAVRVLGEAGFFLCDTLVFYRGSTARFSAPTLPGGLVVRLGRASDRADLEAVARASFTGFRGHYHADPRLDPAAATEGYVEWCLSSLSDDSGEIAVAERDGELAGFATVKGDEIVLNGVHPRNQGQGIYGSLVDFVGHRLRERGTETLASSTQIDNFGPQKVWMRRGLEICEARYTLHGWFGD